MNINGHDNKADVIQNVIENIDDGLYSNAKAVSYTHLTLPTNREV